MNEARWSSQGQPGAFLLKEIIHSFSGCFEHPLGATCWRSSREGDSWDSCGLAVCLWLAVFSLTASLTQLLLASMRGCSCPPGFPTSIRKGYVYGPGRRAGLGVCCPAAEPWQRLQTIWCSPLVLKGPVSGGLCSAEGLSWWTQYPGRAGKHLESTGKVAPLVFPDGCLSQLGILGALSTCLSNRWHGWERRIVEGQGAEQWGQQSG